MITGCYKQGTPNGVNEIKLTNALAVIDPLR